MMTLLLAVVATMVQPDPLIHVRDPQLRAVVATELQLASNKGLPTSPLIAKALEGQLKAAPSARIQLALKTLAGRMELARTRLGTATDAELIAAADALAAGVPPDALAALRRVLPQRSVTLPIGVLTELVTRGVDPTRATREVLTLIGKGATPQQLLLLGDEVGGDVRRGQAANAALDLRVRGLMLVLAPGMASTATPVRP
jgi:hypothetical protein